MNKMAKGAIATAAGVVLLIGGGGTLAVWNEQTDSQAGTIATGDLDLVADPGLWSVNGAGQIKPEDIGGVKIVPGDVLVYTQLIDIKVLGDNLTATLTPVVNGTPTGFGNAVYKVDTSLTHAGTPVPTTSLPGTTDLVDAVATITFTFDRDKTLNREGVNATYDFAGVGFSLVQDNPAP